MHEALVLAFPLPQIGFVSHVYSTSNLTLQTLLELGLFRTIGLLDSPFPRFPGLCKFGFVSHNQLFVEGQAKMARAPCLFLRLLRSLRLDSLGRLRCPLSGRHDAAAVVIPTAATAAGSRSYIRRRISMSVCFIETNINAEVSRCRTSPARREQRAEDRRGE